MSTPKKEVVVTNKTPMPFNPMPFSAAVKSNGVVYCSGNIGMDPKTLKIVKSSVKDDELNDIGMNESMESIYDEYRPLYRPIPTES